MEADPHIGDRSEVVEEAPEQVEEEEYKTFIGHLLNAPAFLRDNEYILRGYRIGFNTKAKILKSMFMLHNETVNVWSHMLGVFGFFGLFIWTVSSIYASATYKELSQRDSFYIDQTLQNRAEVNLMNHSNAGNINDFVKLVRDYANWDLF
jgi:hypothetical protein